MDVVESASRLFDLLASRDPTFTKHLQPGLPIEEIARLTAPTGIRLPEEVVAFYHRFNLPRGYMIGQADWPNLHGGYYLLGLEDAVDELLNSWRELWEQFFSLEEFPGRSGWFPLLREDANLYILDTANTSMGKCPVLHFSEYDCPWPEFDSLAAMFETLYAWVHEGELAIKNGGVLGTYTGDAQRVWEISKRINPATEQWREQQRKA